MSDDPEQFARLGTDRVRRHPTRRKQRSAGTIDKLEGECEATEELVAAEGAQASERAGEKTTERADGGRLRQVQSGPARPSPARD